MSYKKNDSEWVTTQYSPNNGNTINVSVNNGDKVQWKGINNVFNDHGRFISTHTVDVEGNVMSLLYGDNFSDKRSLEGRDSAFAGLFGYDGYDGGLQIVSAENLALPATTLASECYGGMFEGCASLTTAPKKLPATTLAYNCYANMFFDCFSLTTPPELPATTLSESCYNDMFGFCGSLATAPSLPATTLASGCYQYMFESCTGLTTAPDLPAITLVEGCYAYMFAGCSSLTTAPELPATTLVEACYGGMFADCSNLNYIKAMFTTTPSNDYTSEWVLNVASTGTFVKNSTATWNVTGVNGIPTGWTVQTDSSDQTPSAEPK